MKKLYFLLVLCLLSLRATAQQEHHYTEFMYNKLLLNPAYAGARGVPFLTGIVRSQWVGFEGAPKSQLLSFNTPIGKKKVGLGVNVSHQKIGLGRNFYASGAYSYKLLATKKFDLRFGMMASYKSVGMDFQKAAPLILVDQSLSDKMIKSTYINAGAGVYANFTEKLYIGFSVPQLIGNIISLKNPDAARVAKEYKHFYFTAGGSIPLSDNLNLMPAILLKYVKNTPFDADINLNLDIHRKTTLGVSYRLGGDGFGDSADFLVYRQVTDHLGIGGAYDMTFSKIRNHSSGSFELILQYDLVNKKHTMSNPRFFF